MIDKEKQRLNVSAKLGIALAVVMCLLIAWGVMLVRDKLLLNADEMGTSLAASYAAEEENASPSTSFSWGSAPLTSTT